MAMPGFDCCEISFPARQSPDFNLTSTMFLRIAASELLLPPGSIRGFLEEKDSFIACGEYFFLAILVPIEWPDVMSNMQLVADHLALPRLFEGICGTAKDIKGSAITFPPFRPRGFPPVQRRAEEFFPSLAIRVYQAHAVHRRLFIDLDGSPGLIEVGWALKQPNCAARFCIAGSPIGSQYEFYLAFAINIKRLNADRQDGRSFDNDSPRPGRIFVPHDLIGIFRDDDDVSLPVVIDVGHSNCITDSDVRINDLLFEARPSLLGKGGN